MGVLGASIFAVSVFTMRDSWRAGVPKDEKTELVTSGIYAYSRNPAFLGFDLVYAGIFSMFFNWSLFVITLLAVVMLHFQIVNVEENDLLPVRREGKQMADRIDELLNKPCYVIDFLPQKVSKTANGHFFDVEYYLLNSEKRHEMKNKYVNIILKLMCYYRTSILWNGWNENPKPEDIEAAVSEIMENHSGTLNILFSEENVLLVFEWDCLNLAVYNLTESMREAVEKIALSEGFFCWQGTD